MEDTPKNPKAALDAIASPAPLTLADIALLERIGSPLLSLDTEDTVKNLSALWALRTDAAQVLRVHAKGTETLEAAALEWARTLDPVEFPSMVRTALDSVAAFWNMLPRPENGDGSDVNPKKECASETDSSPN